MPRHCHAISHATGNTGSDTATYTVVAAPADHVSVALSGAVNHLAEGDLWLGDIRVARDSLGVRSVAGGGTCLAGGSNTNVHFSNNRLWILPMWAGTVRVRNNTLGIDVTTPVRGRVSESADGTVSGRRGGRVSG